MHSDSISSTGLNSSSVESPFVVADRPWALLPMGSKKFCFSLSAAIFGIKVLRKYDKPKEKKEKNRKMFVANAVLLTRRRGSKIFGGAILIAVARLCHTGQARQPQALERSRRIAQSQRLAAGSAVCFNFLWRLGDSSPNSLRWRVALVLIAGYVYAKEET